MAILYKANETDFNHLGLGPLNEAISVFVPQERNGVFELEMKYPVEGNQFNELKLDRLIKAGAGHKLKNQRFKIIRITKPMDGIVTVYAEHASYLTQDLALKPDVNYSGNASVALNTWKNNIIDSHPFTVYSDITTTGSGNWSIKDLSNARQALGGIAGSIIDTYGGEYEFDNYAIRLYANRGKQSDALIAYGRNLTELTQEETIESTYTSIYPYAVLNEDNKETILTLPEYFVDSEYVGNYARRKILRVDFSQEKITTVEELRAKAKTYIKSNGVGIPKVNLKVKFIDLAKTLDYKNMQLVEQLDLCDWVTVHFEKFNIKTNAKVIKVIWDDLLEQYDSIEIGEARASLSDSIGSTVDGKLETVVKTINTIRLAADGKTTIYSGLDQPPPANVNDMWYKPVESGAVEMYRWNGIIWKLEKTSADSLAGQIDFSTVNAININADSISTGTITGANMFLNLDTGELLFYNPSNGNLLSIKEDKFSFDTATASHYLIPDNEGLAVVPGSGNTGNDRNAGIRLQSTNFNFYDMGYGSDGGFLHRIGSYPDTMALINKDGGGFTFSHTSVLDVLNPNTRRWDMTIGLYGQFKYGKTALQLNGYDANGVPKLSVVNNATGKLATIDSQFLNLRGDDGDVELSQQNGGFKITHGENRNWLFSEGFTGTLDYGVTRLGLNGHNNASARLSVLAANGDTYGYVSASNFDVQSERKYKDDITDFNGALGIISKMNIHQYVKNGVSEIGIITDEAPYQLLSDNDTKVSLYDYASLGIRGVQELEQLSWNHENRIAELEEKIKSLEASK